MPEAVASFASHQPFYLEEWVAWWHKKATEQILAYLGKRIEKDLTGTRAMKNKDRAAIVVLLARVKVARDVLL